MTRRHCSFFLPAPITPQALHESSRLLCHIVGERRQPPSVLDHGCRLPNMTACVRGPDRFSTLVFRASSGCLFGAIPAMTRVCATWTSIEAVLNLVAVFARGLVRTSSHENSFPATPFPLHERANDPHGLDEGPLDPCFLCHARQAWLVFLYDRIHLAVH